MSEGIYTILNGRDLPFRGMIIGPCGKHDDERGPEYFAVERTRGTVGSESEGDSNMTMMTMKAMTSSEAADPMMTTPWSAKPDHPLAPGMSSSPWSLPRKSARLVTAALDTASFGSERDMGLSGDSSPGGEVHLEPDSDDNSISPLAMAFAKLL
jgi:hypothetical protein